MTERDTFLPGTPSWVDLGSPDVEASAAFYSALFGWQIEPPTADSGGYRMAMLKGRPVAGIGPAQAEGVPPWWTTYVTVDSADNTAKLVEEGGGTVLVPPFDVLDSGRMAACQDPGGAAFSVWEPRKHKGAGLVNEPGTMGWAELASGDIERAKTFYHHVFGWEANDTDMGGGYMYTLWMVPGGDGNGVGGGMPMGDQFPPGTTDHWAVYFDVADCDAMAARVQDLGGTVVVPSMDIPNVGRFAACQGPHGEGFSIIAPASG